MQIDTITLKYYTRLDTTLLTYWDKHEHRLAKGGGYTTYILNEKLRNSAVISCTYIPYSKPRKPMLLVEFSFPKVIFGNNYTTITNLEDAIKRTNFILRRIIGLPPLLMEEGIIHRVDIYYDHQVGDLVPYYVKALQSLEYPYRKTKPWTSEGVQFLNKTTQSKFYNKEKECGIPSTHGMLRQELTIRVKRVRKLIGTKTPNIYDLTLEKQIAALEADLKALDLLGKSIGTADTALRILCDKEGELAGIFYYGILQANLKLTKDMICSASLSHPRSMNRRLQQIVKDGIAPTLTESTIPLPPLNIPTLEN